MLFNSLQKQFWVDELWGIQQLYFFASVWAGKKELEDNTPNMLEWFLGNVKLIATTNPNNNNTVFSSSFSPGTYPFPVLSPGICECVVTGQTSLCVRPGWAGCPIGHPTSHLWRLISSPAFCSLKLSFHIGYCDLFEEKSSGVQCLGYAAALDGCEVTLCTDRHLGVTEEAGRQSVNKQAILGSVHGLSSVRIPTKERLWLGGVDSWYLGVSLWPDGKIPEVTYILFISVSAAFNFVFNT